MDPFEMYVQLKMGDIPASYLIVLPWSCNSGFEITSLKKKQKTLEHNINFEVLDGSDHFYILS